MKSICKFVVRLKAKEKEIPSCIKRRRFAWSENNPKSV